MQTLRLWMGGIVTLLAAFGQEPAARSARQVRRALTSAPEAPLHVFPEPRLQLRQRHRPIVRTRLQCLRYGAPRRHDLDQAPDGGQPRMSDVSLHAAGRA